MNTGHNDADQNDMDRPLLTGRTEKVVNLPYFARWGSAPPINSAPYLRAQGLIVGELIKSDPSDAWSWYYNCRLPNDPERQLEIVVEEEGATRFAYHGDELYFTVTGGVQPAIIPDPASMKRA